VTFIHKREIHGLLHAGHMLCSLTYGAEQKKLRRKRSECPDGLLEVKGEEVKCPEKDSWRA